MSKKSFEYKLEKYKYKLSKMADNKLYQAKYNYYKKMHGGTLEENNYFLLHGTNSFYIDMIKQNGLDGKYDKTILDIIRKYWGKISYLARDGYVDMFLTRQDDVEKTGDIAISFTGQSAVAREYSTGARKFGEGPSRFLSTLLKYINEHGEDNVDKEMLSAYEYINKASYYPGIILAIDIRDFKDEISLSRYTLANLDMWETVVRRVIPPEKIYIRRDNNDYILLLSDEGNQYIKKLIDEFKKEHAIIKMTQPKMNKQQVQKTDKWDVKTMIQPNEIEPILFKYEVINKTKNIGIYITYDTYDNYDYFTLDISNYDDININLDIVKYPNYNLRIKKNKGIDLLTPEIINEIMIGIKWIFSKIPLEDRRNYFDIIVTAFKNTNSLLLEALDKYASEELISTQP